MKLHVVGAGLTVVMLVSSCGWADRWQNRNAATSVGLPFNARLDTGETRGDFTVVVPAEGASLADARESARYPATRHCIELTGFSEAEWTLDPATGDWAYTQTEDGDLIVTGRCSGR